MKKTFRPCLGPPSFATVNPVLNAKTTYLTVRRAPSIASEHADTGDPSAANKRT